MYRKIFCLFIAAIATGSLTAKDYLISTTNTSLLINADNGKQAKFQYYGVKISENEIQGMYNSGIAFRHDTYPCFGISSHGEKAFAVSHPDSNISVELIVKNVKQYSDDNSDITEIVIKDAVYPLVV